MDNNDLVSVIMSTYNEDLNWIEESVQSILNQTYVNIEFIIVVDNPNNTLLKNMLEDYKSKNERIKLILNVKNIGLVKSLNIALQHCSGKYIARMDADDISVKDRIEKQIAYLEGHDLDFVFSGVTVIDQKNNVSYRSNSHELDAKKVKRLLEITNCTYHPTWFMKSEVYRKVGGYREISYCEDYDFSLRSINMGYKIGKMDENILKYRIRDNSVSRSFSLEQYLNMRGILRLYKSNNLENEKRVSELLISSQKEASKEESDKYRKADMEMNEGISLIKQKKLFFGLKKLLNTTRISKYYKSKLGEYIIYTFNQYVS